MQNLKIAPVAPVPIGAAPLEGRAATPKRYLFLTLREWSLGALGSALLAAAAVPSTFWISPWIAVTVFLFSLTVYHMKYAAAIMVPLPHIAIMIAALEYVFAAWAGLYYPPLNPVYDIGGALPYYLSYAGPALVAICAGWALSLTRLSPLVIAPQPKAKPSILFELDILFAVGLAGIVAARFLQDSPFGFAALLLGYLRFVGVYGRMILRAQGWLWRLAIAVAAEVFLATEAEMFNPLLLWCLWTFGIWLYCFRPRFRLIVICIVIGAILLPALQEAKWRLRGGLPEIDIETGAAYETNRGEEDAISKTFEWLKYLWEGTWRTVTFKLPEDFLGDTVARYNQGWIITRTMAFVPYIEPHARGETLRSAARAALLPRFIDPDKVSAGGQANMERYAGIVLNERTSMNLGYAGEMYVNFGVTGGTLACGGYALAFGLLFRWVFRRAMSAPLWWSLVPFVFFDALKGDDGIAEVLNWTTKACFVAAFAVLFLPNLRRALFSTKAYGNTGGLVADPAQRPVTHP